MRTVATVPQEGTLALSVGTYEIDLYPGLNGFAQFGDLSQMVIATVDETTEVLEFVWPIAEFAFDLVDQNPARPVAAEEEPLVRFSIGPQALVGSDR